MGSEFILRVDELSQPWLWVVSEIEIQSAAAFPGVLDLKAGGS
jgi:hypothetical protein